MSACPVCDRRPRVLVAVRHPSMRRLIRQLLDSEPYLFGPGVYDAHGAQLVMYHGFKAVYFSGYSFAIGHLGTTDMDLYSSVEIADGARRSVSALRKFQLTMAVGDPEKGEEPRHLEIPPVIVDMDAGYGNIFNVQRTTELYVNAGVAAAREAAAVSAQRGARLSGAVRRHRRVYLRTRLVGQRQHLRSQTAADDHCPHLEGIQHLLRIVEAGNAQPRRRRVRPAGGSRQEPAAEPEDPFHLRLHRGLDPAARQARSRRAPVVEALSQARAGNARAGSVGWLNTAKKFGGEAPGTGASPPLTNESGDGSSV